MNQKWILVILVFCQNMTSGAVAEKTVKEREKVEIYCKPAESGSMLIWFRVLPTHLEFIASFSPNGIQKALAASFKFTFDDSRMREGILSLNSFSKREDSGSYSCASLKGNQLIFGNVTRLVGEKEIIEVAGWTPKAPRATTSAPSECATDSPCVCDQNGNNKQGETGLQMLCSPIILGSLASGCGLLLLLLIFTILYCNQMRTRRCPHHYKRKPPAPGKKMMTSTHV